MKRWIKKAEARALADLEEREKDYPINKSPRWMKASSVNHYVEQWEVRFSWWEEYRGKRPELEARMRPITLCGYPVSDDYKYRAWEPSLRERNCKHCQRHLDNRGAIK